MQSSEPTQAIEGHSLLSSQDHGPRPVEAKVQMVIGMWLLTEETSVYQNKNAGAERCRFIHTDLEHGCADGNVCTEPDRSKPQRGVV